MKKRRAKFDKVESCFLRMEKRMALNDKTAHKVREENAIAF